MSSSLNVSLTDELRSYNGAWLELLSFASHLNESLELAGSVVD